MTSPMPMPDDPRKPRLVVGPQQQQPQQPVPQLVRPAEAPNADLPQSPRPLSVGPAVAPMTPTQTPHQAELQRLTTGDTGKSGAEQIHNPFLRTAARIGDAALSTFFPGAAIFTPGTQLHHQMLVRHAEHAVNNDDELQNTEAKRGLEQAQAAEQESLPEFHQAQNDIKTTQAENSRLHQQGQIDLDREKANSANSTHLAAMGMKQDAAGKIVPMEYEELSEQQRAVHDLKAAQAEQADAAAALKKAQAANQPAAARLAEQRLASAAEAHQIASRRLGLSEKQYEMRAHGTEGGQALPGAMLNDNAQPVGTAFQQNVRPTGTERNKADLANSAADQIADLKDIVKKRPEIFGPVGGRTTDFTVWLGSQDPDAQRFRAARTIAGDHLAGVFGGRSETALSAIDSAIGHFKDNPEAIQAGLDQVLRGNSNFQKAGKVKTVGSKAGNAAQGGGTIRARDPQGGLHEAPAGTALPAGWKEEKAK